MARLLYDGRDLKPSQPKHTIACRDLNAIGIQASVSMYLPFMATNPQRGHLQHHELGTRVHQGGTGEVAAVVRGSKMFSDRGAQFTHWVWRVFYEQLGINMSLTLGS